MEPAVIAAIITGVVSIVGSIVNANSVKTTNEQSIAYSREAAETAQHNTKDLMDYNSPSYQMSRIVQAGLNPNLAYDNLSSPVPTGAQPSQPTLSAPQYNLGVDDALKVAQINRLNAASENETSQTDANVKDLYKNIELKDEQINVLSSQVQLMATQNLELQSKIKLYSEQQRSYMLDNVFKSRTMEDRVSQIASDAKKSFIEASYLTKFLAAKILNLNRQSEFYKARSNLTEYESSMYDAMTSVYNMQSNGLAIDNTFKQFDLNFASTPTVDSQGNQSNYYLSNRLNQYNERMFQSMMVDEQNRLLRKFGGTEKTFNLIESGSRILLNVSDVLNQWMPTFSKKSVGGVPTKTTVSRFGF